jgi:hypothetical protein
MIWLNKAKEFLAAIAARDHNVMNKLLADKFCVNNKVYFKQDFCELFVEPVSQIKILNCAYANKRIFIEHTTDDVHAVCIICFNDNGRINSFDIFESE